MWSRALLVAALVCTGGSGCGGGDNAPNFIGEWTGLLTFSDPVTGAIHLNPGGSVFMSSPGVNMLVVDGSFGCPNMAPGPTVTVTSETEFALSGPFACQAMLAWTLATRPPS
jgi:hypothetical protein